MHRGFIGRTGLIVATLLGLAGCATSTVHYTPPVAPAVTREQILDRPFETVWQRLVATAGNDPFVIESIDRQSGVISLSFTTQRPSEFVDCGLTERTFAQGSGERRLRYPTADSADYRMADARGQAFAVRRRSRLDGRANVQVVSAGAATRVTVNIRYTITVSIAATRLDGRPAGNEQVILEPTTTRPFTGGELTCAALGVVEARLLDAAAR